MAKRRPPALSGRPAHTGVPVLAVGFTNTDQPPRPQIVRHGDGAIPQHLAGWWANGATVRLDLADDATVERVAFTVAGLDFEARPAGSVTLEALCDVGRVELGSAVTHVVAERHLALNLTHYEAAPLGAVTARRLAAELGMSPKAASRLALVVEHYRQAPPGFEDRHGRKGRLYYVAERMNYSYDTARRDVLRARKAGLL